MGVEKILIPSQARLQRHGDIDGRDHRLDEGGRMVEVFQKRRPRISIRDLLGRASHVDVDDPCALPCELFGGLRYPMRFTAGDLDCAFDIGANLLPGRG